MKQILASLLLVCLTWGASAQTLWRDAPMLASPDDIRALMPEARDTPPARRAADPSALLEIQSTTIADESFVVTYHFESDRLQRIHLRAQPATPERVQTLLRSLQASLRRTYGLPVSTPSRPVAALGTVDTLWSFRRMTVQLLSLDGKSVELVYSANIPSRSPGL
jgi:hypothetical protein